MECFKSVEYLIDGGCPVDFEDSDQATPLMNCYFNEKTETAQVLLKKNAKINQISAKSGYSPLMMAACEGNSQLCQFFLRNGAQINQPTSSGESALFLASQEGHSETCRALLTFGADVDLASATGGETALFAATRFGYTETCRILLLNGANPNLARLDGKTPLQKAKKKKRSETFLLLKKFATQPLMLLLLSRTFQEDSFFYVGYLPLDVFKIIVTLSKIAKF